MKAKSALTKTITRKNGQILFFYTNFDLLHQIRPFMVRSSILASVFLGVLAIFGIVVSNQVQHKGIELTGGWYPWNRYSFQSPPVIYQTERSLPVQAEGYPQLVYIPYRPDTPLPRQDGLAARNSRSPAQSTFTIPTQEQISFQSQYSQIPTSDRDHVTSRKVMNTNYWNDEVYVACVIFRFVCCLCNIPPELKLRCAEIRS